jgi:galactose mutarotase-like enzyme
MRLKNEDITLDVQSLGAAVVGCTFRLPNGETVNPFFANPWQDDSETELSTLPPLLRNLSGEWPCVPFGTPSIRQGLPSDWQLDEATGDWNAEAHGFGSHHDWDLEKLDNTCLRAEISYPVSSPVRRLTRTIRLDPGRLRLNFSLQIDVRETVRLPIGVHPVFDLSHSAPESCQLRVKGAGTVWTFPMDTEPGRSHFAPDQRGASIGRLHSIDGKIFDATQVPFSAPCEDLLMLTNPNGCVTLELPNKGYAVSVEWDPSTFPSCVLWYSNGGRQEYPWNGRIQAIGIEPVAAPFDLGLQQCLSDKNPLKAANVQSSILIEANTAWETEYSITLTQL